MASPFSVCKAGRSTRMASEAMRSPSGEVEQRWKTPLRCGIYARKSTEEGLNQDFNSLDAQREAAAAYISSQRSIGWVAVEERYDDGGYTGGNLERPALQKLLRDI